MTGITPPLSPLIEEISQILFYKVVKVSCLLMNVFLVM